MKRHGWMMAAVAATAMLAAGGHEYTPPARAETTAAVVKLEAADSGKTVEIAHGGKIVVRLPGDPSGRQRWSRVPSPLGPLTVLENRVDRTSRDGKVVKETYVFGYRAAAEGTAELRFAGMGVGAARHVAFTVKIVPSVLAERLADLKANSEHLVVGINFVGPEDAGFTEVYLATPNALLKGNKTVIRMTGGEVRRVVDALVETGCLNQAVRHDMPLKGSIPANKPTCVLTILSQGKYVLHLELGWGLDVLTRLDALAAALDAKGQGQFKKALAPLEAHRAEWQGQARDAAAQTRPGKTEAGDALETK